MALKSFEPAVYENIAKALGLPQLPEVGKGKVRKSYWKIKDHYSDLAYKVDVVLVHHEKDSLKAIHEDKEFTQSEKTALFNLRGIIVDLTEYKVRCRSFGYTPTVTVQEIKEGKVLKLKDQLGLDVIIDPKAATFQPYYSGPLIRLWKYNGMEFHSTQTTINTVDSKFGNSPTFLRMYLGMKGPSREELWDEKPTSNYTYVFMASHFSTLMETLADVGFPDVDEDKGVLNPDSDVQPDIKMSGWLVFLQAFQNMEMPANPDPNVEWTPKWKPITQQPATYIQNEDGSITDVAPVPPPVSVADGTIYIATKFGAATDSKEDPGHYIRIVNMLLKSGYSRLSSEEISKRTTNPILWPGEALVATLPSGQTVKIASPAYQWRNAVCGDEPNRYFHFCQLAEYAVVGNDTKVPGPMTDFSAFDGTPKDWSYASLFPYLGAPSAEEFTSLGDQMIRDGIFWTPPTNVSKPEEAKLYEPGPNRQINLYRLANIALCYMMAVPCNYKVEVAGYSSEKGPVNGFFARFLEERKLVSDIMVNDFLRYEEDINTGNILINDLFSKSVKGEKRRVLNAAGKTIERWVKQARLHASKPKAEAPKRGRGGKAVPSRGKKVSEDTELRSAKQNIRGLVLREKGGSLYAVIQKLLKKESRVGQVTEPSTPQTESIKLEAEVSQA